MREPIIDEVFEMLHDRPSARCFVLLCRSIMYRYVTYLEIADTDGKMIPCHGSCIEAASSSSRRKPNRCLAEHSASDALVRCAVGGLVRFLAKK